MKKFIFLLVLIIWNISWADLEHRTHQGQIPAAKELSLSRGCFEEIKALDCGHPSEDQEYFNSCLAEKRELLTLKCKDFFDTLYGPHP